MGGNEQRLRGKSGCRACVAGGSPLAWGHWFRRPGQWQADDASRCGSMFVIYVAFLHCGAADSLQLWIKVKSFCRFSVVLAVALKPGRGSQVFASVDVKSLKPSPWPAFRLNEITNQWPPFGAQKTSSYPARAVGEGSCGPAQPCPGHPRAAH